MILRVRLQNYMSFGELQTIPLEPITVIVGPNNSGKTSFLHFVDFANNVGAPDERWHRPRVADGRLHVGWDAYLGSEGEEEKAPRATYGVAFEYSPKGHLVMMESATCNGAKVFEAQGVYKSNASVQTGPHDHSSWPMVFSVGRGRPGLQTSMQTITTALTSPIANARHVHLRVDSLRSDNQLSGRVALDAQGSALAALIAHWILAVPEKMAEFNSIIARCLPEMRRVLVRSPDAGMVRLEFEQKDGQRFDAANVSDGVMVFAGLIAHALEAPPNALVMLEEPERGIHPRRLVELVDLLRTLVKERRSQFVLATHSPALLNVFRDEPDAIVMFRRGPNGTLVRQLTEVEGMAETLARTDPGEVLASGMFSEADE